MDDLKAKFPSNSHKSKDEVVERKLKPVVTGSVKTREKSLGKKFSESFMGEDTKSVGHYILTDVLIPALKDTLYDMITGGSKMALFGRDSYRPSSGSSNSRGLVNYASYSKGPTERAGTHRMSDRARATHDFKEIIFETRGEAEEVLYAMVDLVLDYGAASVADLYQLAGLASEFTDNKYGWDDPEELKGKINRDRRGGYVLSLPRPRVLD